MFLLSDPACALTHAQAVVPSCCRVWLLGPLCPPVRWVEPFARFWLWSTFSAGSLHPSIWRLCGPSFLRSLPSHSLFAVYWRPAVNLESCLLLMLALPSRMASPSHLLSGTVHPSGLCPKLLTLAGARPSLLLKEQRPECRVCPGPDPFFCRLSFLQVRRVDLSFELSVGPCVSPLTPSVMSCGITAPLRV